MPPKKSVAKATSKKKVTKKVTQKPTAQAPKSPKSLLPTLQELLEAGAHFGHRKERSAPTSRQYTFVIRDGVCVINLEETQAKLQEAMTYLKSLDLTEQTVLFVGTKRQARDTIRSVAEALHMPYIADRWMGGMLTNFEIIRENVKRLQSLDQILADDAKQSRYKKKELLGMKDEAEKLHRNFDGIVNLERLPDVLVIVDPHEEAIALREARALGIPVVALCDTDADPEVITYPIPANDDAPKTVQLILGQLKSALERPESK